MLDFALVFNRSHVGNAVPSLLLDAINKSNGKLLRAVGNPMLFQRL